ncbi:MAG TPA: hypothetical protein VK461_11345 [Acidimicrobiales bacterium]|nr:hypothetical protein [Acidimicrobiales bacterium]
MNPLEDVMSLAVSSLCRMPVERFNEAHWPAAVIAAWRLSEDPDIDPAAIAPMSAQVHALMREMSDRFTPPAPSAHVDVTPAHRALAAGAGRLSALGHDVIFGALALTAMQRRPELATRANVNGLVALIEAIQERGPGGPFPGWDDPTAVTGHETVPDLGDAATLASTTLDAFVATGPFHEGLDQGVVVHLITHAHATLLLDDLGLHETSRAAREAQRTYLTLVARRPDPDGSVAPGGHDLDPRTASFWEHDRRGTGRWMFGHVFKMPLAFEALVRAANRDDPAWRHHLGYTMSVT